MNGHGNLGSLPLARDHLARVAFIDCGAQTRRWTFGELESAADGVAARLAAAGHARGTCVAIVAGNGAPFLIAYLGIMRAGLVAVPINHRLPVPTIAHILGDCEAALVLAEPGFAELLGAAAWTDLDRYVSESPGTVNAPFAPRQPDDDVAEILYTSGSTGRPKGVVLTHGGQLWAMDAIVGSVPPSDERSLVAAPLYHMNGLIFSLIALRCATEFVLMRRFEARSYIKAVSDHRCTMLSGIPTMLALVAQHTDLLATLDLSCVRMVSIGSAPLTDALLARIRQMFPTAMISNGYGTTEAGPAIFGAHPKGLPRPPMSIGYPLQQVQCRLVGGPTADQGVLEVRSPAAFREYLNLPEETARRRRDGWCVTGDVMVRDADGFFFFLGRDDDMFVCGGENLYPGEIERLLERHPDVMQAAVVAVADEVKGAIPIAFVVGVAGRAISTDDVKAFTLREGPAYAHPRAVILVEQIPMAGTHKVDKRALIPLAVEAARALGR